MIRWLRSRKRQGTVMRNSDMMRQDGGSVDGPRAMRTRAGRPVSPVPWMILGMGRAWAWDTRGGLLQLTNLGDRHVVRLSSSALDPRGTTLRFERRIRGLEPFAPVPLEHDLLTGQSSPETSMSSGRSYGPAGERLDVVMTRAVPGRSTRPRYTLTVKGSVIELCADDHIGYNQSGLAAQFTTDGRHLALSHQTPDRQISGVTTIDLVSDKVERFDGVELVGSGCWSPDGSRLLVASSPGGYPEVLDTRLGSLTRLDIVIEDPRNTPWLTLIGWLDDASLLAYRDVGPRMHLVAVDVKSGQRRELVSVARPAPRSEISGIFMAQYVAQGSPASCGPAPA